VAPGVGPPPRRRHRVRRGGGAAGGASGATSPARPAACRRWAPRGPAGGRSSGARGKGKGAPYAPLRPLLPGRVRLLLTIGEDGPRIRDELGDLVPAVECHTVESAVQRAAEEVRPGEVVLFSPACASFDQFRNFEERGRYLAAPVRALG